LKLVEEGKLSAADAYELIEAFENSPEEEAPKASAGETPPAEPSKATEEPSAGAKDPLKCLVEAIEKLGKDAANKVNWQEVAKQARESAQKASETIKSGFEQAKKGGGFSFFTGTAVAREVALPLAVPEGKLLRIENPCGEIKVTGGYDIGTVIAQARFRGGGDDLEAKADAYTLIIEENESAVVIKQPDVPGLSVDLEVHLAGNAPIEIRGESGGIEVIETKSGCRVSSRSGNVHLKGLNGQLEISAQSGDLTVEDSTATSLQIENKSGDLVLRRVTGSANVRTTSGGISIRDCELKTLAVDGVSGDVAVDLRTAITGAVSIRTVSGNTLVAVPDGSDCRVALKTLRGHVKCAIPLTEEARLDGQVTGKLGDGKGTLDVSAVTGDITLEMHVSF
jgi:hypothetical protein